MSASQTSLSRGSFTAPEARTHLRASTPAEMDAALADLQAHKDAWVATGIPERLAMLEKVQRNLEELGERWVFVHAGHCQTVRQPAFWQLSAADRVVVQEIGG